MFKKKSRAISSLKTFRYIFSADLLKELFIKIKELNKEEETKLNTFQLAVELVDKIGCNKECLFQIFSKIIIATIEGDSQLIDNYTLYIYVRDGEAILYNNDILIKKFFIDRKLFDAVRIDYYHHLSNF